MVVPSGGGGGTSCVRFLKHRASSPALTFFGNGQRIEGEDVWARGGAFGSVRNEKEKLGGQGDCREEGEGVISPGAPFLKPRAPKPALIFPAMVSRSKVRASGPEGVGRSFFSHQT